MVIPGLSLMKMHLVSWNVMESTIKYVYLGISYNSFCFMITKGYSVKKITQFIFLSMICLNYQIYFITVHHHFQEAILKFKQKYCTMFSNSVLLLSICLYVYIHFFFPLVVVLGFELRALRLQNRPSTA
jgi:hypothetical protein